MDYYNYVYWLEQQDREIYHQEWEPDDEITIELPIDLETLPDECW